MKFNKRKILRSIKYLPLSFVVSSALIPPFLTNNYVVNNNLVRSYFNDFSTYAEPTKFSENTTIDDERFHSIFATSFDTDEKLRGFVYQNKKNFFSGVPDDFSITDVAIFDREPNLHKGEVNFVLGLKRYYNYAGVPTSDNGTNFKRAFKLVGFKNEGFTTEIRKTTIDVNLPDVKPSSTSLILDNDPITIKVKEAVIPEIINLAPSEVLSSFDISFVSSSPSDPGGYILARVVVKNNKAIENGIVQNEFVINNDIELVGFFKIRPTVFKKDPISDPSFNAIKPSEFNQEQVTQFVFDNIDKFASDYPREITKEDIVVSSLTPKDSLGILEVVVGLKKYYNSESNLVEDDGNIFTSSFVLTGFESLDTRLGKLTFTVEGVNNIFASNYTADDLNLNNELKSAVADSIVNPNPNKDNPTSLDIFFNDDLEPNNSQGTIKVSVTINNSKAIINGQVQQSHKFNTKITLDGFSTQGLNTEIKRTTIPVDLQNVIPSSVDLVNGGGVEVDAIKRAVIEEIINIAPNQVLNGNDIKFSNAVPDNLSGKIRTNLSILNNKAIKDGIPQLEFTFDSIITISGLKSIEQTKFVLDERIEGPGPNAGFANKFDEAKIKQYMSENPTKFIIGSLPNDWLNFLEINITESSITKGEINFTAKLNKYYNSSGVEVTSPPLSKSFVLTGFRNDGLTTTLSRQEVNVDLPDVIASTITEDNNDNTSIIAIKKKLIEIISSPANDSKVSIDDLSLSDFGAWDNAGGSLQLKITLKNSKYWNNGITEEIHHFDEVITIKGFKLVDTSLNTILIKNSIKYNEVIFKNIFNDAKGFSVDWKNENLTDKQNNLMEYMNGNIETFFDIPNGVDINIVKVKSVRMNEIDLYDRLVAEIIFSGIENGIPNDNMAGKITIQLRESPNRSAISENIQRIIREVVDNSSFNTSQDLEFQKMKVSLEAQQGIAEYLNTILDELPNVLIPFNGQGTFSSSDIEISNFSLDLSSGFIGINVSIGQGEFKINVSFKKSGINVITYDGNQFDFISILLVSLIGGTAAIIIFIVFLIFFRTKNKALYRKNDTFIVY